MTVCSTLPHGFETPCGQWVPLEYCDYKAWQMKMSHSQQMISLKEVEQFTLFCPSTNDFGCPLWADLFV